MVNGAGINKSHGSSVCLVGEDGRPVFCAMEERFTRVKLQRGMPHRGFEHAAQHYAARRRAAGDRPAGHQAAHPPRAGIRAHQRTQGAVLTAGARTRGRGGTALGPEEAAARPHAAPALDRHPILRRPRGRRCARPPPLSHGLGVLLLRPRRCGDRVGRRRRRPALGRGGPRPRDRHRASPTAISRASRSRARRTRSSRRCSGFTRTSTPARSPAWPHTPRRRPRSWRSSTIGSECSTAAARPRTGST